MKKVLRVRKGSRDWWLRRALYIALQSLDMIAHGKLGGKGEKAVGQPFYQEMSKNQRNIAAATYHEISKMHLDDELEQVKDNEEREA